MYPEISGHASDRLRINESRLKGSRKRNARKAGISAAARIAVRTEMVYTRWQSTPLKPK
jgi:hypothetical protein